MRKKLKALFQLIGISILLTLILAITFVQTWFETKTKPS